MCQSSTQRVTPLEGRNCDAVKNPSTPSVLHFFDALATSLNGHSSGLHEAVFPNRKPASPPLARCRAPLSFPEGIGLRFCPSRILNLGIPHSHDAGSIGPSLRCRSVPSAVFPVSKLLDQRIAECPSRKQSGFLSAVDAVTEQFAVQTSLSHQANFVAACMPAFDTGNVAIDGSGGVEGRNTLRGAFHC